VLFSSASHEEALHHVLADMKVYKNILSSSDTFRDFINNISLSRQDQEAVLSSVNSSFHQITVNFIQTLIDNKRLVDLPKIIEKYIDYYKILNKEENITIISAQELSEEDRTRVEQALQTKHQGVKFTIAFQVEPAILGGLQMYSGNKFLDCSLLSRFNRIMSEVQKLSF